MLAPNNLISFELGKLEAYIKGLQTYLDNNPIENAEDRIDYMTNERTGAITSKTIANKETQLRAYTETLSKMPKLLLELNTLRKAVSGEEKTVEARGDGDVPGFMKANMNKGLNGHVVDSEIFEDRELDQSDVSDDEFDDED